MSERTHQKLNRSTADRKRLASLRTRFQEERPSQVELIASGDAEPAIPLGEFLSLLELTRALKKIREDQKLSLSEVAKRSDIDKAAISRLENDLNTNPTVTTLMKYANAVGAELHWTLTPLTSPRR